MATAGMRKSTSINDYPEHLNPFREDEKMERLRFWTLTKKPGRRSSFSLNNVNIKDFRNTWSLKSFMKKSKKGEESQCVQSTNVAENTSNGEASRDPSPVVFRRAMQYGTNPERATITASDRYVYGGSITPLPRSRFQERLRSTPPSSNGGNNFTHMTPGRASFSHRAGEPYALPGLARSEAGGSRLSITTVGSTNPFEDVPGQPAVPARRKKKRAAPLPPTLNATTVSEDTSASIAETTKKDESDVVNDPTLNVELKIIEDVENNLDVVEITTTEPKHVKVRSPVDIEVEGSVLKLETKEEPIEVTVQVTENESVKISTPNSSKLVKKSSPTPVHDNTEKPESIENADSKNNNTEAPKSPVELRTTKSYSSDSDNKDVTFDKVNIRLYRRNSSLNSDSINANDDTDHSPKRSKSLTNTNTTFTTFSTPLHIDEGEKDVNDNQAPQRVVCKLLVNDKPRKGSIDNSVSSTEKEFIEIDRTTRELEQELQRLSKFKYVNDVGPKKLNANSRNSVSDIRSRFENPAIYSPNPIPKPRRSRAGSESPVRPE